MVERHRAAKAWMDKLDEIATTANYDQQALNKRRDDGYPQEVLQACAQIALVSQMAYSNAVAAARFYMDNQLWTIRGEHK